MLHCTMATAFIVPPPPPNTENQDKDNVPGHAEPMTLQVILRNAPFLAVRATQMPDLGGKVVTGLQGSEPIPGSLFSRTQIPIPIRIYSRHRVRRVEVARHPRNAVDCSRRRT